MAYTKGYRYNRVPGDNQSAIEAKQMQNPAYASTIELDSLDTEKNIIDFQRLTGALTVTADVINPFVGDAMKCLFKADGTNRVVTFGTGFVTNSTLTVVASKQAVIEFAFTSSETWLETNRFIQS